MLFREPGEPSENDGGDLTIIDWQAGEPFLHAWVEENWVTGRDWPEGAWMDLTINRDDVEIYSASDQAIVPEWNLGITFVEFDLTIDLVAGDEVILTDGLSTHTHVVTELAVPQTWYADVDKNEIYGTDADLRTVYLKIHEVPGYDMTVEPASDGTWTADFNQVGYSFVSGSGFVITQHDAMGGPDSTIIERFLPVPRIRASLTDDWYVVHGCSRNESITFAVYDDGGALLPGYPLHPTTNENGHWGVDVSGIDLVPGMRITLTDDATGLFKELILADGLSVDGFDADLELVSGTAPTAPDGSLLTVVAWNSETDWYEIQFETVGGAWEVDFDGLFDIASYAVPEARLDDGDGDETVVRYQPGPGLPRVGLIYDMGGPDDASFNWFSQQGLQRAIDEGLVEGTEYSPASQEDYPAMLEQCVAEGNELCISVGFALGSATLDAAYTFPETNFAIVDFEYESYPDNLRGIRFAADEVGYLAGTLAAMMSGTNTIGAIGGVDIPPVAEFICGYRQGAWDAIPETNVFVQFAGTFSDLQVGIDIAQGMMNEGADVIFGVAGPTGNEAIKHATQSGAWAIGVDTDQWITVFGGEETVPVPGSDRVLSSAMKRLDNAVYFTIVDQLQGLFSSGTQRYNLAGEGVGLAPFHETAGAIPQDVLDALANAEAAILAGGFNTGYPCGFAPTNSPPEILSFQAPVEPVLFGQEVAISADFVDPDEQDMHRAWWYWGDGLNTEAYIDELNGSGTTFGNHTYASPGVYSVRLELHDDADNMADASYEFIVIYNPTGGFVTGGGWIDSPEGAYYPDPLLTGRASFGFVSKYKRGASTPEGVTQFQFRVADLNFHSEAYDWLVIGGMRAQYKGTGTINGEGAYRFILTAIDGDLHANDGVDRFRIKIWDPATEEMIYDNQLGDLDDADPVTVLSGGSIVIHRPMNPSKTTIGLVTDLAGLDDMGWNWLAYQGLLQAEQKLGVKVNVYEPASEGEFVTATQQCADEGNDLCIGVGFFLGDAFKEVSELNPDTYFAILDFTFENYPSNVRGIMFAADQAGYLAGTLAGLMSNSNTIGAVGGIPIPPVNQFICGYQQGAWDANPDANVLVDFAGNFEDPASGAEIAANMMAETADVIFGVGGAMGNGAILHAAQNGAWAVGVDTDQWLSVFGEGSVAGSEFLLSSAMKRLDNAVFYTIEDLLNGAFGSGTVLYTLKERYPDMPGVGLAPFHGGTLEQDVVDALEAAEAGLIDGSIWAGYPCGLYQEPEQGNVLHVVPAHPEIHGHEWPWEAEATVRVYDDEPEIGALLYEDTKAVSDDPWCGEPCFDLSGILDILPGYVVTMTDGEVERIVHVTDLQVTGVDVEVEKVFGTAEPGSEVYVSVHDEGAEDVHRRAVADGSGTWFVDFSVPGAEDWEQVVYDLVPGSHGRSIQLETMDRDDGTLAYWNAPNPMIEARPQEDRIEGWDWTEGQTVYLEVDYFDEVAQQTIHYEDNMAATLPPWDDPRPWVSFELTFDLEPDDVITMSSGTTIKEHTVTTLEVTGIDQAADEVYGTAAVGANIEVWVHETDCWQGVEADGSGNWGVSFSGCYDIGPGSAGAAVQYDEDGDLTWIEWWVPNPVIEARPEEDRIEGWDWTEGQIVYLEVDYFDEVAQQTIHYEDDMAATLPPWDDPRPWVSFNLNFDLEPDDVITMSSGTTIKEHTVTDLQVTDIGVDTDSVSGTAALGANLSVWPHDTEGCQHDFIVEGSINWSVSFSSCGYDIGPGSAGAAVQFDEDGDLTWIEWGVPNPMIEARPEDDRIEGWDWSEGQIVYLEVDYFDEVAQQTIHYEDNMAATLPPWGDPRPWVSFELTFDLEPDDVITMSSGTTIKVHTVTDLQVTGVDEVADEVYGTTDEGAYIEVWPHEMGECWQGVEVGPGTDWGVSFSGCYDIGPGSQGAAVQYDEDGDKTWIEWRVPDPHIEARPPESRIEAWDWPDGTVITLYINDSFHGEATAQADPGDPIQTVASFEGIMINPGDIVKLWGAGITKELYVTNLQVTGVDADTDTVSGTADPGAYIEVWTHDPHCWQGFIVGQTGEWSVIFGGCDLAPGTTGTAAQPDDDRDWTWIEWWVPNP
ncbi:MAG: BMP family ABC transporter substrate-binding protein [Anaerolineales bacterium]